MPELADVTTELARVRRRHRAQREDPQQFVGHLRAACQPRAIRVQQVREDVPRPRGGERLLVPGRRGVPAARIQAGRGLVEEDQPWPPHQGHRDVKAPLHAAGVGGRGPRRRFDEVELLQQPACPRPPLGRRDVQQAAYEEQVLLAGEPVVDGGELPGNPDGRAYRADLAAHVMPHDAGRACVRRDQGGQDLHRGGLSRAVGPEQREDLTLADAEVDPVQDDLLTVGLAQPVRGNRGAGRVIGQCVHATDARTLTQGQGQAIIATF
jgi:hypothetical protein